ncbi:MAG: DUF4340 domain-containing protein [Pirellulaceae bacterium]|nr:DUF4340 domain-containing protein [Pirellulaceae bacterium]
MNENIKTILWIAVAVLFATAAWAIQPIEEDLSQFTNLSGKQLFPDFKKVADLEKIELLTPTKGIRQFYGLQLKKGAEGNWELATSGGYPAFIDKSMPPLLEELADLTVIEVVDTKEEIQASSLDDVHKAYGLLEPTPSNREYGVEGIGRLVRLKDNQGKIVLKLIIGNQVRNSLENCYVRIPEQDQVYVVAIDPFKIHDRFVDWADVDLLGINPLEVSGMTLQEFQIVKNERVQQAVIAPKIAHSVELDGAIWKLKKRFNFVGSEPVEETIEPDEYLETALITDIRDHLGSIEIRGVLPKSKDFENDLVQGKDISRNQQNVNALGQWGMMIQPLGNGGYTILPQSGGLRVRLTNGLEYYLMFGNARDAQRNARGELTNKLKRVMLVSVGTTVALPTLHDLPEDPEEKAKVELENNRLLDAYYAQKEATEKLAKSENARFAPWVYEISDETYRTLMPRSKELVKKL